jgi:large subunit ribosomal protein L19
MNIVEKITRESLRKGIPDFRSGDTVCVHTIIKEGDKERIQAFEGVVLRKRRGGKNSSFTVRKVSYGVGVERVFPLHSPLIDHIEVVTRGRVRRSRLYYLRELSGKAARVREQAYKAVGEVADETETAETAAAPRTSAN